jgi:hypothetical protein
MYKNIEGCDVPVNSGEIRRAVVEALMPIVADDDNKYAGASLMFHNTGNTVATALKGYKTIQPGETFQVGNLNGYDFFNQSFDFKFQGVNVIDDEPAVSRLEVTRIVYKITNV